MDINSSVRDSSLQPSKKRRKVQFIIAGLLALATITAAGLTLYSRLKPPTLKPVAAAAQSPWAELISAKGIVTAGKPGSAGWRHVAVGARLMEGDLVQTDALGEACIRYSNGTTVTIQENTVFTIRNSGDGSMEISVAAPSSDPSPASPNAESEAVPQAAAASIGAADATAQDSAKADELRRFVTLDRIVPYGRSLELIGKVEAGSRLSVNEEIVDITGDGSFKHFTNPFPAGDQKADLVLKVTDLAGQTRTVTATYDFKKRIRER